MKPKKTTVEKYRKQVDEFAEQGDFQKALEIASRHRLKTNDEDGYLIVKTRLLAQYKIKESDLETLSSVIKDNPHYRSGPSMILFFEPEVRLRFELKPKYKKISQKQILSGEGGDLRSDLEQIQEHIMSV